MSLLEDPVTLSSITIRPSQDEPMLQKPPPERRPLRTLILWLIVLAVLASWVASVVLILEAWPMPVVH